jgi:UDP-glucose 4-epimerase
MKILLSGSRGNLGRAISAHTSCKVVGLNREDWDSLDILCSGSAGPFADGRVVEAIIHCAYDLFSPVTGSPVAYVDSNVMATARLLAAASRHGIGAFYYISSAAVYGNVARDGQSGQVNPATIYGMTKRLNEQLVRSVCTAEGISFGSFRIFNLYGGNDRFSVIHHLDLAIRGIKPFVMNNHGLDYRDFIHVEDAAKAILSIVEKGASVGEVDVGTGLGIQISEVVNVVRLLVPGLPVTVAPGQGDGAVSRADITSIRGFYKEEFVKLPAWLEVRYGDSAKRADQLPRPA